MKTLKTASIIFLGLALIAPVVAVWFWTLGQTDDTNQYAIFQWAFMGIYNLPFVITSSIALVTGDSFFKKGKINIARVLFSISIISSILGIALQLRWLQ